MTDTPPTYTLQQALEQIEKWCYESLTETKLNGSKKVVKDEFGNTIRIPVPKKVKEHLEALYEDMDLDDWLKLANVYKTVALGSAFEAKKRVGRPPGAHYGLGSTERAALKREEAKRASIWYPGYPDGCVECKGTDYAHASGGMCNRCRNRLRRMGIGIREYRKLKAKLKTLPKEPS